MLSEYKDLKIGSNSDSLSYGLYPKHSFIKLISVSTSCVSKCYLIYLNDGEVINIFQLGKFNILFD